MASAINSGLKKLARVTPLTPGRRLYRGISNMAFESRLLAEGRTPGENSFVEAGFSSATPNLSVALQYASGKCATLLEIDTGAIDRGYVCMQHVCVCVSARVCALACMRI